MGMEDQRLNTDDIQMAVSSQFYRVLVSSHLWDAVVYECGVDGVVAAHPVGHIRPVPPESVGVVLHPATLDPEPGNVKTVQQESVNIDYYIYFIAV